MNDHKGPNLVTSFPSLIWTRARTDWEQDQQTALAVGIDPSSLLHIPCLSFQAVPVTKDVQAANYVIFTSSNAVRYAMQVERLAQVIRAAVKIFAIGAGTAQALSHYGLTAVPGVSGKDGKELAEIIVSRGDGGSFLIPITQVPAFDLAGYLKKHGRQAEAVVCYETLSTATKSDGSEYSEDEAAQLAETMSGVICFASPSAVRGFDNVFHVRENELGKKLIPVAIGKTTCNEVLQYFPQCKIAESATTNELLSCAADVFKDPNAL